MKRNGLCAAILILLVLAPAISGCGTAPADQAKLAEIQSVYVKPVKEPDIRVMSRMGGWSNSGSNVSFNDLLNSHGLHLGAETQAALIDAFKSDGYNVSTSAADADSTVTADIESPMYFINPPIAGGGCTPFSLFNVEMRSRNGAAIFSHTYRLQVGGNMGLTGHISLPAASRYEVQDCAALWSDPQLPVDAFRSALHELTRSVAGEVAKRTLAK